jgi:hypothetical protein
MEQTRGRGEVVAEVELPGYFEDARERLDIRVRDRMSARWMMSTRIAERSLRGRDWCPLLALRLPPGRGFAR